MRTSARRAQTLLVVARELDRGGSLGALLRRPEADRDRTARRRRALLAHVWTRGAAAQGQAPLRAVVTDAKGRKAEAQRVVRVCK